MADGYIRSKAGFTSVQNTVAKNPNLSLKAKGLFLVIQAHITIPDKSFKKSQFFDMVCEGEKAFESTWNELKEAGYLKTHIFANNGRFITEYELLDEAKEGPHTFYYDNQGRITKTNLDLKERRESAEKNKENSKKNDDSDQEEDRTPEKGVTDRILQNGTYGNGSNGNGTYANGVYGKGDDIYKDNYIDNDLSNKTDSNTVYKNINNKTDYNTSILHLQKPIENVPTRFEEEEEKVKNQINYTKLKLRHPANKDLLNSIVIQMTEMMCETKSKTEISMNSYEDTSKVKQKLSQITYDDIEDNLLQLLPDKKENSIKNPKGYLRRCLINLVDRRDTVCYTKEIKGNKHHSEYDFEAMEREFGLR